MRGIVLFYLSPLATLATCQWEQKPLLAPRVRSGGVITGITVDTTPVATLRPKEAVRPKERPAPARPWLDFWPINTNRHGVSRGNSRRLERGYHDQQVLRFNTSLVEHEAAFRKAADELNLDVWDSTLSYIDVRVTKKEKGLLRKKLPESMRAMGPMVLVEDLERAVAATYPSTYEGDTEFETAIRDRGITEQITQAHRRPSNRRHDVNDVFFRDYQPLSVIVKWMRLVDSMFRARGFVRIVNIGKSYEGRDIPALRVGLNTDPDSTKPRKTILVTGGLHAREWVSISSVNYLAWSFITSFGEDAVTTKILEEFDIVFVPVLNPDGYEYTWNVDRLWRKSRQRTSVDTCRGFDLDHSFGYQWRASDAYEPCSEIYGGQVQWQATEAAELAMWAENETEHNNVQFVAYLDLHSYSQQVLYPYAYSCDAKVPNLENMQEVAMNMAKHMRLSSGETYSAASACSNAATAHRVAFGSSPDVGSRQFVSTGGSAIDYFHHVLNARYSYQIKLRDTGSYGFLLPSDNIVPVGEEVVAAVRYFGDYMLGNNGIERSKDASTTEKQPVSFDDGNEAPELRRR
jgi:extracellular matrix protein 14